jgi:nucleoside-diphosphate-sugar epimerase
MRIFVTGASGWIGSATVPELISAGHQVLGLARSDDYAKTVADMGAHRRWLAQHSHISVAERGELRRAGPSGSGC